MKNRRLIFILMVFLVLATACRRQIASAPPAPTPAPEPPAAAPAPTISLTADSTSVQEGESVTLSWKTENANSVSISELGEVEPSGSRQVTPKTATTYVATATGPGGSATDSVRVTVNPRPAETATAPPPVQPSVTLEEDFRDNVQDIYFEYDRAVIQPAESSKLQSASRWLREHPGTQVTIEGHCDERGSEAYNLGLGDRRANAVKEFLIAQGIQPARINTVSYGEERPVCTEQNESCWSQNRRAHFVLVTP